MHQLKTFALIITVASLAACQRPAVPPQDKPPEPQALARNVQAPLEKARGVQQTLEDAEQKRRAQEGRAEKE